MMASVRIPATCLLHFIELEPGVFLPINIIAQRVEPFSLLDAGLPIAHLEKFVLTPVYLIAQSAEFLGLPDARLPVTQGEEALLGAVSAVSIVANARGDTLAE